MAITFLEYRDGNPHRKDPEWVGRVLCTREENGYHDSYFYAVVWDDEKFETQEVMYDTTAAAAMGACDIDADYQTLVRATGKLAADLLEKWEKDHQTKIREGDRVRITSGPHAGESVLYVRWMEYHGVRYGLGKTVGQRGNYVFVSHKYLTKVPDPLSAEELQTWPRRAWQRAYRHYRQAWELHTKECDGHNGLCRCAVGENARKNQ